MDINNISLKNGFRMIEASAGTGKTFTLAHLALRNIVEKDIRPEELLIVSYTKKSAKDLREKILERFRLFKLLILNEKTDLEIDLTLRNWFKCLEERNTYSIQIILEKIESVIANPKNLTITTIDGFLKKILDEHNLEFNIIQKQKIDNNLDHIYKTVISELWIKEYLNMEPEIIQSIETKQLNLGRRFGKKINKGFFLKLIKIIDQENILFFSNKSNYYSVNLSLFLEDYIIKLWPDFYISWKSKGYQLYQDLLKIGEEIENNGCKNSIYKKRNKKFDKVDTIIDKVNEDYKKGLIKKSIFLITQDDDLSSYFYEGNILNKIGEFKNLYDENKYTDLQNKIYLIKYGFYN